MLKSGDNNFHTYVQLSVPEFIQDVIKYLTSQRLQIVGKHDLLGSDSPVCVDFDVLTVVAMKSTISFMFQSLTSNIRKLYQYTK
jgi:hypothetical protein